MKAYAHCQSAEPKIQWDGNAGKLLVLPDSQIEYEYKEMSSEKMKDEGAEI